VQLEGKSPRALASFAIALDANGRTREAAVTARAALVSLPNEARLLAIADETREPEAPAHVPTPSFWERLRTKLG